MSSSSSPHHSHINLSQLSRSNSQLELSQSQLEAGNNGQQYASPADVKIGRGDDTRDGLLGGVKEEKAPVGIAACEFCYAM